MEGGSVLFVAVNKDVCPSQISSGLMSNSLRPGLSKANTPTALPRPSQMNRAFLASGPPPLFHAYLWGKEGRGLESRQVLETLPMKIWGTQYWVFSICKCQSPKKVHIKLVNKCNLLSSSLYSANVSFWYHTTLKMLTLEKTGWRKHGTSLHFLTSPYVYISSH